MGARPDDDVGIASAYEWENGLLAGVEYDYFWNDGDGNPVEYNRQVYAYSRDAQGRLERTQIERESSWLGDVVLERSHVYDAAGRPVSTKVLDERSREYLYAPAIGRSFAYDDDGRLASTEDVLGNILVASYDDVGRLVTMENEDGVAVVEITYEDDESVTDFRLTSVLFDFGGYFDLWGDYYVSPPPNSLNLINGWATWGI